MQALEAKGEYTKEQIFLLLKLLSLHSVVLQKLLILARKNLSQFTQETGAVVI